MNASDPNQRFDLTTVVALATLALFTSCGCFNSQPRNVTLNGRVTEGGTPVRSGMISLFPAPGVEGPASGVEIIEGAFKFPETHGLVKGTHRVEVTVIPRRPDDEKAKENPTQSRPLMVSADPWTLANPPRRYKEKSQTVDLNAGANSYDLDLTLKKK